MNDAPVRRGLLKRETYAQKKGRTKQATQIVIMMIFPRYAYVLYNGSLQAGFGSSQGSAVLSVSIERRIIGQITERTVFTDQDLPDFPVVAVTDILQAGIQVDSCGLDFCVSLSSWLSETCGSRGRPEKAAGHSRARSAKRANQVRKPWKAGERFADNLAVVKEKTMQQLPAVERINGQRLSRFSRIRDPEVLRSSIAYSGSGGK